MPRIVIGIPVREEPARLRTTLTNLAAHTSTPYNLLLLPDGVDELIQAALREWSRLPQSATAKRQGDAACFNRLLSVADADVYVFLENGTLVGPGWLDILLEALSADPRNGLAGPSTNRSWNEQGVFPQAGSTVAEIAGTAADALRRFDGQYKTLEPLYSLADFCYAVRREVIEAIGEADEGYKLGPCWEMDYNIRAERAGFHGVWACAAYVHRAPVTARRRREEMQAFASSKRRYQDKFCGAHLRGETREYRVHCQGGACPNFAPAMFIQIRADNPIHASITPARSVVASPVCEARSASTPVISEVLVSCIMPTCNRRNFIPQALHCFFNQDYPNLELIVVDDGTDNIADCLPQDDRIRYIRLDRKLTIGAKRNMACGATRGSIIVHWDDDDWYPRHRVSTQVRRLLENQVDICGTSRLYYFSPAGSQTWEYRYSGGTRKWVAGNTLAYTKAYWERHRFADVHIGEDARFVWRAIPGKIIDLDDSALCIGTIHAENTSPKRTQSRQWRPVQHAEIRTLLGDDYLYYMQTREYSRVDGLPLVSCIMPTYNRRPFIELALKCYLSQDYPATELIVVDDGGDSVADLVSGQPSVRYIRLTSRLSIGAKRNLACQHARGAFIAHWDDDDWYAPTRLRYQLTPLMSNEADVTGLVNSCVLQLPGGKFWETGPELHRRMFKGDVHGGTLVFRKTLFDQGLRYPHVNLAEDARFLQQVLANKKRLLQLPNGGMFVYVRHGRNAWKFEAGRFLDPSGWKETLPPKECSDVVLEKYCLAAEAMTVASL